MPREDRATWKSNYFMKIIVSVGSEPSWDAAGQARGSGNRAGRAVGAFKRNRWVLWGV